MEPVIERQMGIQPLDAVLVSRGLANHDLVAVSTEQLTHKMVQKGRKGRRLTRNVQQKILAAINALTPDAAYRLEQLFNYRGK